MILIIEFYQTFFFLKFQSYFSIYCWCFGCVLIFLFSVERQLLLHYNFCYKIGGHQWSSHKITYNLLPIQKMFLGGGVETWTKSLSWDDTRCLWDFRCSRLRTLCVPPPRYNDLATLLIILTSLYRFRLWNC